MSLSSKDVEKIGHLARLNLSLADISKYTQELNNILDFIQQISATNTEDIEPLAHPLELNQRLRPDVVTEDDLRTKYQRNAPQTEAGLYLVPKVIEES